MTKENQMPIPLRPLEAVPMPSRRRARMAPPFLVAETLTPMPEDVPLGVIRAEPIPVAPNAERVSDNDGWPCLPLAER